MELWIRTQNRERLIKCENIYIDNIGYTSQKYYISADSIKVTYKLGEYKTEERALEVIDEIQKLIKPVLVFQNCICDEKTLKQIKEVGACIVHDDSRVEQVYNTVFYQMPEE